MTKHIKDVFGSIFDGSPKLARRFLEQEALLLWNQIVSKEVSLNTKPIKVFRGRMEILVKSPAWVQELRFLKQEFMVKINQTLGSEVISEIRFQSGNLVEDKKEEVSFKSEEVLKLNCQTCGINFSSFRQEEKDCPDCRRIFVDQKIRRLHRLLSETPWISYEEVRKNIKEISKGDYERVRRDRRAILDDFINQLVRECHPTSFRRDELVAKLKKFSLEYAFLKTGIPLKDMDDEIVKRVVGEGVFAYIKDSSEKKKKLR